MGILIFVHNNFLDKFLSTYLRPPEPTYLSFLTIKFTLITKTNDIVFCEIYSVSDIPVFAR